MPGHSRPKDGVASASLWPGHPRLRRQARSKTWMAGSSLVKPGHDDADGSMSATPGLSVELWSRLHLISFRTAGPLT